ncbi:MAG: bifunctional (p)ppGpp synthetase/guanosine-3',5'-bis(diphosphate) 3'-pyrophosphohydrolase [Planctomycetes bacterium]|nr:bifunctional (p)ppGpp synthetase/guanosine-3',5'-bis(diphosphate) 3'-pyrophosphohydrolase [Planctomycetota bacterium]
MTNSASPKSDAIPEIALRALSFAARRHGAQWRKDGETPYVAHPARVLFILGHVFKVSDPDTLAAGALHDTIEDTTTDWDDIAREFNPRIADFVALLSKDKRKEEGTREGEFVEQLAQAPIGVKLCKLADTLDNLLDAQGLPADKRRKALDKARGLLSAFAETLPAEWRHAYDLVRAQAGL